MKFFSWCFFWLQWPILLRYLKIAFSSGFVLRKLLPQCLSFLFFSFVIILLALTWLFWKIHSSGIKRRIVTGKGKLKNGGVSHFLSVTKETMKKAWKSTGNTLQRRIYQPSSVNMKHFVLTVNNRKQLIFVPYVPPKDVAGV